MNGELLSIHPADLPNLLLQSRPQDCTELEFYRIRKMAALAISKLLQNKKSKLSYELQVMVEDSLSGLKPNILIESPDSIGDTDHIGLMLCSD
jgi:hypothetical protein